jgi:crotonobetainyl-CoA:carnitine CoA-transferase CaiB-like acyl-CoA transferase
MKVGEGSRSNGRGTMGPLDGVRVLDVGTALAGPVCATILGDFGAEVIKIEQPGRGDPLRGFGPSVGDVPLWWMIEGRNKESITLKLSTDQGQEIVRRLIAVSDVLVENFRPGTMDRWGLGYEAARRINPRLVYVAISGFGQTGPYSTRGAYDRVAQAMAGLTYLTGYPDQPPVKPGIGITDYSGATVGALGAMLALYARDTRPHGEGQLVDVALCEALLRMYHYHIPLYGIDGTIPERVGNTAEAMAPAECFRTRGGEWVMIAVGSDRLWHRLAEVMGQPELIADPRFVTNETRTKHLDDIHAVVRRWVETRDAGEVTALLEAAEVPVARLYTAKDIYDDQHFRFREAVMTVRDPLLGDVSMQGVVPKLSATPGTIRSTGPRLGHGNRAVIRDLLGMSETELQSLIDSGAMG